MKRVTTFLIIIMAMVSTSLAPQAAAAAQPPLIISEVQTGGLSAGVADGRQEFIELYNPSDSMQRVDGWQLNYYGATSSATGPPTRVLASLQGTVVPGGHVLVASPDFVDAASDMAVDVAFSGTVSSASGWLAAGGGVVQLADATGTVQDAVSWGTAKQVGNWWKAPEMPAGNSIQRLLPGDPAYTADGMFAAPSTGITPQGGDLQLPDDGPPAACNGIVLSEILPNAAGTDAGHEFIEVLNPTEAAVLLQGCSLRLGDMGTPFALPAETLAPGAYRAFSDTETGITLPNTTGDTVWLLGANTEQNTRYADGMDDNQAWADINGTWQVTNQPTPGVANKVSVEPASNVAAPAGDDSLIPCGAGKERNPETNRCRAVATAVSDLPPCATGQTRSPDTNRCRAVLAASTATLTPCKPGQERNPDTNRCRSTATTASSLAPCAAGQERNPDTNRCRKATAGTNSFAKIHEDKGRASAASAVRWWVAGAIAVGALGYGAYEWRSEISKATNRLRRKHLPVASK